MMQTFKLLKRILQHPLRIHCWLDSSDSAAFFNTILKCLVLSVFIQQILSTFCFFAFEAATFNEYVESFFYLLGGCLMSSWYLTFLRQRNKFIDLSNDLDEIIESRELIQNIKFNEFDEVLFFRNPKFDRHYDLWKNRSTNRNAYTNRSLGIAQNRSAVFCYLIFYHFDIQIRFVRSFEGFISLNLSGKVSKHHFTLDC